VSFSDKPSGTVGAFAPVVNFPEQPYNDGERVTGPMALFNGVVYFSTFRPALSPGLCTEGQAFISGMDFLTGANMLDVNDDGVIDTAQTPIGGQGTVVFGAQLARVPSCFGSSTAGNDGWMAGSYKSETSTASGSYQLVFNSGVNAAAALTDSIVGASGAQTGTTNVMHLKMAAPKALVRLHSWATVSE
jgi:type IV pilus assembly protein PilY1